MVRVNGEEKLKRDWMFKLVGNETFTIGKSEANCIVKIEPYGGFSYQYSLEVNGKSYKTFTEQQAKVIILNFLFNLRNIELFVLFSVVCSSYISHLFLTRS